MYYVYILQSSKSNILYYGYTLDLRKRFKEHNSGESNFTKGHMPWKLVWYSAFDNVSKAKDFELYLKSGSGKAFAYKRLVDVALSKGVSGISRCSEVLTKDTLTRSASNAASPEAKFVSESS